MKRGEMTAFISLVFVLLVGLIGAVIEGASVQTAKNYRRADMDRALQSVFAEYHRELLAEYDIFGIAAGYETGTFSFENIVNQLEFYEAAGMTQEPERLQLLTDDHGQPFKEQAVRYMKSRMGVDLVEELTGNCAVWEEQSQQSGSYEEQGSDISQELDSKLQEGESELPSENNPLENISNIKKSNLLQIVVSNPEQLSQKQISLGGLPSHRNLQKGIGRFPTKSDAQGKISSLFFCQYLLEHFGNAVDQKKENTLSYEMEYILEGKESDQQNLEAVVKKLLLMRSGANYLYLLTDAGKQAEAETLAVSLSTAIALPVLTGLVKQAILVAWAFGEAVMDIRALLDGKRVALIKTHDTWQLQLSGLLKLGTAEDQKEGMDAEGGLRYKEYLMFLFFLKSEQVCTMRALDLIEMEMKKKPGEETFQVDHCVTKLQVKSKCKIRRGVNYQFSTYFGYE